MSVSCGNDSSAYRAAVHEPLVQTEPTDKVKGHAAQTLFCTYTIDAQETAL